MPLPHSMRARPTVLLVLALTLLACNALTPGNRVATDAATPVPDTTSTDAPATLAAETATGPAITDGAPTELPSTEVPTAAVAPLTGYDWDDRSVFAAALTPAEQQVLDTLPGATVYHLALEIDPGLTRVAGHAAVRYTNQEETALNEVVFRLFPNLLGGELTILTATVDDSPVTPEYIQENTSLRVPLAAPLEPGTSVVVALSFEVNVPTTLERNYGVLAAAEGVLALAHFFPYAAVYDDEGWNDEIAPVQGDVTYGDASFFIVQIRAPAALVLAGAGIVVAEQRDADTQTVTYAQGPARDFYLAASEHYAVTTGQSGDTTVRVYAPEAFAEAAQKTVDDATAALATFAARYGPYPYSELDLATTPTYALGIEYSGVIALTNNLLDPAVSTTESDRLLTEIVVVHEVGHQWFYNLVGNDQLDDPWLDESLTQYVTWQYFLDRGQTGDAAAFYESLEGRWSSADFAEIPIGQPVAEYENNEYSAIIYGRGALFFEALAEHMGTEAFDAFMADYAQTYRWGIATPEGMRAVAERHCACDLGGLWAEWVD